MSGHEARACGRSMFLGPGLQKAARGHALTMDTVRKRRLRLEAVLLSYIFATLYARIRRIGGWCCVSPPLMSVKCQGWFNRENRGARAAYTYQRAPRHLSRVPPAQDRRQVLSAAGSRNLRRRGLVGRIFVELRPAPDVYIISWAELPDAS